MIPACYTRATLKLDAAALEAIVREVVQRILQTHPELFDHAPDDGDAFEHYGRVLSEGDLIATRKAGKRAIRCDAKTIITPLAKDRARDLGIRILTR